MNCSALRFWETPLFPETQVAPPLEVTYKAPPTPQTQPLFLSKKKTDRNSEFPAAGRRCHACPPFVVGVGIGGNFEVSCLLAKKALLRPLNRVHAVASYARLEATLLEKINNLGIGPQGMGGKTTALGVLIETFPCHIASLPVAVNIECHAHRHKTATL